MIDERHDDRSAITVRARRPADIPALADLLLAQQPTSRYPFRNPLPFPVEQFLHADDAVAAWTAELDGRPVGHVCHTRSLLAADAADAAETNARCARAHGCEIDQLGWVSTLFVGEETRGMGVGRRLLGTVVDDIRGVKLYPCLKTLAVHPAALALYTSTGWREVMRQRPEWLRDEVGDEGPEFRVMVLTRP